MSSEDIYFFSFKPLYKNLSISQGSTSIAIATKYSSDPLKNELLFVVNRVILVLLIPVLRLTCDLLTDRCAKNNPKSVSKSFSFAANLRSIIILIYIKYYFIIKIFEIVHIMCIFGYIMCNY